MKEILLTQGKVALVDDEDFEWLSQWKWYAARQKLWYAGRKCTTPRGSRFLAMHREIFGFPGVFIDHANGNTLDNRRMNLRCATRAENIRNSPKRYSVQTSSRFKGVSWNRRQKKFCAYVCREGRLAHLGYFPDEMAAARAYDDAARRCYGEFACFNFPREGERGALTAHPTVVAGVVDSPPIQRAGLSACRKHATGVAV